MKIILMLIGILSFTFLETEAQTLSELTVYPFVPSDTGSIARAQIDLMASFIYPKPQEIQSITMKIGNAAGQSQLSQVIVPVQQENGNYYTVHKNGVYRISNSHILVKTSNLVYTDLKGKYITITLTMRDGSTSQAVSIQY